MLWKLVIVVNIIYHITTEAYFPYQTLLTDVW